MTVDGNEAAASVAYRVSESIAIYPITPSSPMAELCDDDLRVLISEETVFAHRARGLTPDRPVLRGTAQNPDVFFQAREASNGFYDACTGIVERTMRTLEQLTGRRYNPFEYVGEPSADRVIVLMGSGAETAQETVEYMTGRGEKVGILKVRLYRPFSRTAFIAALPEGVRNLAVLDRTKEPGSIGDPLYLDVTTALAEAQAEGFSPFKAPPRVIAGRYGLSSKEFTPAMIKSVFDEMAKEKPKRHFTVGIVDDVAHTSLGWDPSFQTEPSDVSASVFYGLGADGTVGANKNSIKIVGQETELYAQGYFVYDSKKSGAITVSHLRTSKQPIRSAYLVNRAHFVACHQFEFIDKIDVLEHAAKGASFLLNAPFPPEPSTADLRSCRSERRISCRRSLLSFSRAKATCCPSARFRSTARGRVATAKWEKRNIAVEIPVWDSKVCIQCNQCALVCPHAAIRAKVYDEGALSGAPETFKSSPYKGKEHKGKRYTIQVAPEDCTGCNLCVNVCPAKDRTNPKHKAIDMHPQAPLREPESVNYDFFLNIPDVDRRTITKIDHKSSQFFEPLFEYSGACAGCGETPYLKLLTQLFGDRLLMANATGCSSIYGGNLPTTPYTTNRDGRGPAWSNSLFEDNAEFGFGFRMALDGHVNAARSLVRSLSPQIGDGLATSLLDADQSGETGIAAQRERIAALQEHEWESLNEMRANMSLQRIPDPAAYERANFRMALS